MNQNNRVKSDEMRSGFQVFKGEPVKTKKNEFDLKQHYVVPWELTEDDTKRWSFKH